MNDQNPITDPARPECAVGQDAIQRLLDGEPTWDTPEAAAHRVGCTPCREELALASAFARLPDSVLVPAEFSDKLLKGVVKSQRHRRYARFAAAGVTLAASVLIFVFSFRPREAPQPEVVPVVQLPAPKIEPQPPVEQKKLGESVGEAREAFVQLTKRKASETRDQSARLMPEGKLPNPPEAGEGLEPLADARTGAEKSVEPIRTSARRAFNMFIRAADPPERRPQP